MGARRIRWLQGDLKHGGLDAMQLYRRGESASEFPGHRALTGTIRTKEHNVHTGRQGVAPNSPRSPIGLEPRPPLHPS